jgi:LuxR family maltose regulon positive regulatory protein
VHRSVAYLIDNAARCLHIVIATRSDPPFPLAGYRAAGTMTEVRVEQLAELREFLLATSILDGFDADICDYILETNNSASMLEQIEHSHLFLVSLDSRRTSHRYHHLFRDWLRHEHRITAEPERIVHLHKRAAAWTLENGFSEQAVRHLIKSSDLEGAQLES